MRCLQLRSFSAYFHELLMQDYVTLPIHGEYCTSTPGAAGTLQSAGCPRQCFKGPPASKRRHVHTSFLSMSMRNTAASEGRCSSQSQPPECTVRSCFFCVRCFPHSYHIVQLLPLDLASRSLFFRPFRFCLSILVHFCLSNHVVRCVGVPYF